MAKDDLKDVGKKLEGDRRLSAIDRALLAAIGDGRTVGQADDPAATRWPDLWRALTMTEDAGHNYVIQPGVLTIQLGPSGVLATLTIRDLRCSWPAACDHLHEVFDAIQAALVAVPSAMRTWGKDEPRLRKRRPK